MDETGKEGANAGKPQEQGLDISIFLKPVAEVNTSIGRVFLFPLRTSDIVEYKKLSGQPEVGRIRNFLPCIASLSAENSFTKDRVAITKEDAGRLSDDEVEALAVAYASSGIFRVEREGAKDRAPVNREPGEVGTAYLDRLLQNEIKEQAEQSRKVMESFLGSTQGIFDQVRKSSLELGDSWRQLDRMTKASAVASAFDTKSLAFTNHMAEQTARMARERAEDREMLRLTAETSVKSAKTLQELAEAASTMLDRLDQRDNEAKRTTRHQLWIAVGSVILSLFVSVAAFYQDKENIKSGDRWQDSVLEELKAANTRSSKLETENQSLRQKVEYLNSVANLQELKSSTPKLDPSNTAHKN